MRFPPILNRAHFERSGFLKSFPHLAGTIHSFTGTEQAHRELLRAVEEGEDWSAALPPAEVVLTPAACYPVYPALRARCQPEGGWSTSCRTASGTSRRMIRRGCRCFACTSTCGRRSGDGRRLARDVARPRAIAFADVARSRRQAEVASDPFFGRGGKLLAVASAISA